MRTHASNFDAKKDASKLDVPIDVIAWACTQMGWERLLEGVFFGGGLLHHPRGDWGHLLMVSVYNCRMDCSGPRQPRGDWGHLLMVLVCNCRMDCSGPIAWIDI